ncbi:MAG: EthD family reductase [Egibacteraceae bacterium]
MATFVALYAKPDDVEGFEAHYRTTHLKIVEQWPGVRSISTTRFAATPRGAEPPFHLMTVAEFATDEEMAAALRSDPGVASAKDAMAMKEQFGVAPTMLLGGDLR